MDISDIFIFIFIYGFAIATGYYAVVSPIFIIMDTFVFGIALLMLKILMVCMEEE